MLGGNQPDRRASLVGKLSRGQTSKGTPKNCNRAAVAVPSCACKSSSTRWAVSIQAGSALPSLGQLV
ncbi:MAG: hypothetical protein EBS16_10945 [Betaproteobacteria bacterium]|nr:hypothetical protein [Betaproteobacteria bacterium]